MKRLHSVIGSTQFQVSDDYFEWLDAIASRYDYTISEYDNIDGTVTFVSTSNSAHIMPVLHGKVNPNTRWMDFQFELPDIQESDLSYASSLEWLFTEWSDTAGSLYTSLVTDEHAKAW